VRLKVRGRSDGAREVTHTGQCMGLSGIGHGRVHWLLLALKAANFSSMRDRNLRRCGLGVHISF
jgi:hypothetical protein